MNTTLQRAIASQAERLAYNHVTWRTDALQLAAFKWESQLDNQVKEKLNSALDLCDNLIWSACRNIIGNLRNPL